METKTTRREVWVVEKRHSFGKVAVSGRERIARFGAINPGSGQFFIYPAVLQQARAGRYPAIIKSLGKEARAALHFRHDKE